MNHKKMYEPSENMFADFYNFVKPYVRFVLNVSGMYVFWICAHLISANLYVYYCAQPSLYGAIMSPIMASSPHCKGLRWAINNGANAIDVMWLTLGTWICSKIVIFASGTRENDIDNGV
jgi:hypothetical protein